MAEFNAELYLRLLGERSLLGGDPSQGGRRTPLDEAAGALIAVGAITLARAREVSEDYVLARALRSPHGHHMMGMRRARGSAGKAKALRFGRVVPVQIKIETAEGTLDIRSVRFGQQGISLSIVHTADPRKRTTPPVRVRSMRGPQGMPWGAPAPTLTDDRGTSTVLQFSGGWGGSEATGQLTSSDQLSQDTQWLELDGTRVLLQAGPVAAEVTVEPLIEGDADADRYLWRRLAVSEHGPPPEIQPAIDALIAAGALAPDDPVIASVEAVQAQLPHHPGMPGRASARRMLPEPWRSLLRRVGAHDGPSGSVAVGAVTPLVDGHRVGLLGIDSHSSGFQAEVELSPGTTGMRMRFGGIPGDQLAWWCRDDRGNHYLGALGSWSGRGDYGSGQINFWPPIDPRAQRLAVLPTATTERAVIAFPLQWTRPIEAPSL